MLWKPRGGRADSDRGDQEQSRGQDGIRKESRKMRNVQGTRNSNSSFRDQHEQKSGVLGIS